MFSVEMRGFVWFVLGGIMALSVLAKGKAINRDLLDVILPCLHG